MFMYSMYQFYVSLLTITLFTSCGKEESYTSNIPYARVEINIHTQTQNNFDNPYNSQEYTQKGISGYGGVIAISNADASFIYAYDMCCPYESPTINKVEKMGASALNVKCPKCRSVYNIADGTGTVISGPSKEKLRKYRVIRDGKYYRIRN